MRIGWTLQGADAVNLGINAAELIPGWLVMEGGFDSGRIYGRFAEVWGGDLRHTAAKI
jgi:hypothetical protein